MTQKRPTIKEIAQRAGVSPTLVSFYLNDRQPNKIAEKTKERIAETIRELGYRPSRAARTLRSGKSRTIGLVIGEIAGVYASFLAQSLLLEAVKHDYQLLISATRFHPDEEKRCLENMLDRQVDGILYHLYLKPDSVLRETLKHYPILQRSSMNPDFCSLTPDLSTPIREGMRRCKMRGKRKIAGLFTGYDPANVWFSRFNQIAGEEEMDHVNLDINRLSSCAELHEAIRNSGADTVLSGTSTQISRLLNFYERNNIRDYPEFIYSYTLPSDYIRHEAIAGAIINDFKSQVEGSVGHLIDMIENGVERHPQWLTPSRFADNGQLLAYHTEQVQDPYFNTIVEEWNAKRIWDTL